MSPEEAVIRGERARQFLEDPFVTDAFESCKKEILALWEATPARDVDAREWLWKLYQAQLRFESIFKGYVDSGKIAADQLRHKQSIPQRIKNAWAT